MCERLEARGLRSFAFPNRAGDEAPVEMQPRVILTEPEAIIRAALMDLGLGLVGVPHVLRAIMVIGRSIVFHLSRRLLPLRPGE